MTALPPALHEPIVASVTLEADVPMCGLLPVIVSDPLMYTVTLFAVFWMICALPPMQRLPG